jgi:predicted nucleic acid-binding protein
MLVDTDVLIWYMRGHTGAYDTIENLPDITLSAVTQMELMQGMRNKGEMLAFETTLVRWQVKLEPVTQAISDRAVILVRDYALSHAMKMGDALIAATALELSRPLLTANSKHYRMIKRLDLHQFRP